jgi:Ca2+-binding RTX toxin-like protein
MFNRTSLTTILATVAALALCGSALAARIDGTPGNNFLYGTADVDGILAGAGDDVVWGGSSTDFIFGGAGRDLLHGDGPVAAPGDAQDFVWGESGNDHLWGDGGNDYLLGGEVDDTVRGGSGTDELYGEGGNDMLIASGDNAEADTLYCGPGIDVASHDANDKFNGGSPASAGCELTVKQP